MTRFRFPLLLAAALAPAAAAARQPAVEPVPAPARPQAAEAAAAPAADTAYALGYRIGGRIAADHEGMGLDLDRAALARGLTDAVTGAKPALDEQRFARALEAFEQAMAKRQAAFVDRMREAARKNLAAGREFLEQNAKRPGVVTRDSGLQFEVLREGTGPAPRPDDIVVAHYRGTHVDGREFDATDPAGEPAEFPLGEVVPGWREALTLMKAGAKWRIWLPAELAYGVQGSPPVIEPNEVLVFEIELLRSAAAAPPRR